MANLRFRINNNGNSTSDYLDHFWELVEARKCMSEALRSMHPHGRNYQTSPNPTEDHRHDVDIYLEAHKSLDAVDTIVQGLQDGIIEAQKKGQD